MNRPCFLCDQPCSRVCIHPDCDQPAFFCAGPCVKGMSQVIHTHNKEKKFISVAQLEERLKQIATIQNPHAQHQKYTEDFKKKIELTRTYINHVLNSMEKEFENDLLQKVIIKTKFNVQYFVSFLKNQQKDQEHNMRIQNQLKDIFDDDKVFGNKREIDKMISILKTNAEKCLSDINNIAKYISYSSRIKNSKILIMQGQKLKKDKQYNGALKKFNQAKQLDNSNFHLLYQIADCYSQTDNKVKSIQTAKEALRIKPQNFLTLLFLARNCAKHYQFYEQAIKYYTQLINLYNKKQLLIERGNCYMLISKYQQALADYHAGYKQTPNHEQYISKIETIAQRKKMSHQYK